MSNMIKYKGQLYRRVDSFKDEISDEVREIDSKLDEIIKKAKVASSFAAKLGKGEASQEVVEAIRGIEAQIDAITGQLCEKISKELKNINYKNNTRK